MAENPGAESSLARALWMLFGGAPLLAWLGAELRRAPEEPARAETVAASTARSRSAATDEVQAAAPPAHCVARLLSSFRAMAGQPPLSATEPPAPTAWLDQVDEQLRALAVAFGSRENPAKIRSMIATLPDPVDTGLGYQAEVALRSLRSGLEQPVETALFRDRTWLPWDDRELDESQRHESEACRTSLPGVMLLRGNRPEQPEPFVLLMVGESPTGGLNQAAMSNALRIQARLDGAHCAASDAEREVRIVGPMFSGSAQSMRLALQSAARECQSAQHFLVVSGTATGGDVPRWLGTIDAPERLPAGSDVKFSATVVPEATVECSYLGFLVHRLGVTADGDRVAGDDKPRPLSGVATLSESGTEFGSTLIREPASQAAESAAQNPRCPWVASATFQFPFHVSALRDAYESLDQRDAESRKENAPARATSLDASLREARAPLDPEADLSAKTRAAEDVGLSRLIEHIADLKIKHVAIHATDVGDAIFLARRIRDVAPDVRLAFFDSDALLLHPEFQRELIGSLVVTPYPFLGLSPIGDSQGRLFHAFESGFAEGLYNAVLAQRGARPEQLSEYTLGSSLPLPVWVATIGRGSIVPNRVAPTLDCPKRLYGSPALSQEAWAVCEASTPAQAVAARRSFFQAAANPLELGSRFSLPHGWNFLFVVLCLGCLLDSRRQRVWSGRFSQQAFPEHFEPANDRQLDWTIARTKWRLYGAIRSYLFVVALGYMAIVYLLSAVARQHSSEGALVASWPLLVVGGFVLWATLLTARAVARFTRDYRQFARCVGATLLPWSWRDLTAGLNPVSTHGRVPSSRHPARDPARRSVPSSPLPPHPTGRDSASVPSSPRKSWIERVQLSCGVLEAQERQDVARTSFAQLRILVLLSVFFAAAFAATLLLDTAEVLELSHWFDAWSQAPLHRLTLTVLRAAQLSSGVSPSTPALLCIACVYVWAAGRMARLALAHQVSRASPTDGETDLVSTPIRLILYPSYLQGAHDAGFTEVERDLANSIWRPLTGPYYPTAALTLAFFPVVLFLKLKPISTLEGTWGTLFLGMGLGLCVALVGCTLVQLVQYWVALQRLLQRTLDHPLGPVFSQVPSYVKDSVDRQISRPFEDFLRWSACARQFQDLWRSASALADSELLSERRSELQELAGELDRRRLAALSTDPSAAFTDGPAQPEPVPTSRHAADPTLDLPHAGEMRDEKRTRLEAALSRHLIRVAAVLTAVLERPWSEVALAAREIEGQNTVRASGHAEAAWLGAGSGGVALGAVAELHEFSNRESWPAPHRLPRMSGSGAPASGSGRRAADEPGASAAPDADAQADALTPLGARYSAAELGWLRSAQVFAATVVTLLVQRHVRQFRCFLYVTTGCSLLLLLAVASYAFEPYRLMLTFMWVTMGSVVLAGLWIFVQMDRNTLMSHIAGTSPDRLTWDAALLLRVVAWVIVPLLTVAAAQYPQFANLIFQVAAPFTRALH